MSGCLKKCIIVGLVAGIAGLEVALKGYYLLWNVETSKDVDLSAQQLINHSCPSKILISRVY